MIILREKAKFNDQDMAEMLELPIREASLLNKETIMFSSDEIQQKVLVGGWKLREIYTLFEDDSFNETQGEKYIDCFLEATGIAAGIGIINMLGSQALDQTVVKAAVKKAVKKIGSRALGWIGIGLMVGEYIWCMNRD